MSMYLLNTHLLLLVIILNSAGLCGAEEPALTDEQLTIKLKEDLLCDYDKTVRPVVAHTTATTIHIMFMVRHVDFLAYSNTISIKSWFQMKWNDEHFTWNPEDYGGTTKLMLTTDEIWIPDLSVYNKFAYENSKVVEPGVECVVDHGSLVRCMPKTTIEGNCVPDFRYWPFDEQNCTIKIGSWFHHGDEMNYNSIGLEETPFTFRENEEWKLKNMSVRTDPGIYDCCPNSTYPSLLYTFVLQRRTAMILAAFIIPILVFVVMSLMALWLDPQSSERVYLTLVNIPCHIMFAQNMSWDLFESIPYVALLLRNSLLLLTMTLVETLVVRCLLEMKQNSPVWLVTSFSVIVNTKPGQILLFSELNPKNTVADISADDSNGLVDVHTERPKEWYLLGRVIDRIYFAICILTYFIMIIVCIPK